MAYNSDAVRVGVEGKVYAAPVGTTLPTDTTTALDAAFVEVGLISEDALTEHFNVTKEMLRAWQKRSGIRSLSTEVSWTWQFKAMETSPLVLELYYAGAASTVAGSDTTTTVLAEPGSTEKAFVVELIDGNITTRYAIPKADVTDRGESGHTSKDGTMYDLTVSVLATDITDLGYRISNDPTLLTLAS